MFEYVFVFVTNSFRVSTLLKVLTFGLMYYLQKNRLAVKQSHITRPPVPQDSPRQSPSRSIPNVTGRRTRCPVPASAWDLAMPRSAHLINGEDVSISTPIRKYCTAANFPTTVPIRFPGSKHQAANSIRAHNTSSCEISAPKNSSRFVSLQKEPQDRTLFLFLF